LALLTALTASTSPRQSYSGLYGGRLPYQTARRHISLCSLPLYCSLPMSHHTTHRCSPSANARGLNLCDAWRAERHAGRGEDANWTARYVCELICTISCSPVKNTHWHLFTCHFGVATSFGDKRLSCERWETAFGAASQPC
jgi:hypothetical protein